MFTRIVSALRIGRVRLAALLCGTAVCLLAGGISMNSQADPQTSVPVEAQVSVDGSSTIVLGEPISLYYSIANTSDNQGVGVGLGTNKTQWYRLSLTDAEGKSAQVVPDTRSLNPAGLHSTGTYFLPPNGRQEDHIVVTRFFQILHPGKYTLVVQVHIPYVAGSVTEETSLKSNLASDIRANNKILVDKFVFPIMVSKADPARLEARAIALRKAVTAEGNVQKYWALLDALFSMPEAQALSSWEALASQDDWTSREILAEQFARVHSVKTVDLLVRMLDNPSLSPDEASFVKIKIDESYNAGDATVKEHIKVLAASRGASMPEKVTLPQVSD